MAQHDFIDTGHPFAPVPIDLRGDVRPNYPPTDPAAWPPGALDRLTADIVAADPDNLPEQWLDDPAPPVSPTTQAMALRAGQRHVDAIRAGAKLPTGPTRDLTPDEMASRYGLYADDNWPPLDSRIYDMFQQSPPAPPRAPERPLRAFPGVNGRVRIDADKTRFWTDDEREQDREAIGSAGVLALGVASAVLMLVAGIVAWGVWDWVHTMAGHVK